MSRKCDTITRPVSHSQCLPLGPGARAPTPTAAAPACPGAALGGMATHLDAGRSAPGPSSVLPSTGEVWATRG